MYHHLFFIHEHLNTVREAHAKARAQGLPVGMTATERAILALATLGAAVSLGAWLLLAS